MADGRGEVGRRRGVRQERRVLAAALLAVLLLTTLAVAALHAAERAYEQTRLEDAATTLGASVTAELQRLADLGRQVGVATARLGTLDADAYEALLDDLEVTARFGGLAGVSFVSHVPRERLGDFLALRRAEGDGFELLDDAGEDRLRIVSYVHPPETNRPALGVDLTSRPELRAAADRAIEADTPSLSPFTEILQLEGTGPGAALHVPAHDLDGTLLGTVGVVLALEPFLEELTPLPAHVAVRLSDPNAERFPDGVRLGPAVRSGAPSVSVDVDSAGQTWTLEVKAAAGFSPPWTQRGSTYLVLAGLIAAGLVGLLVRSIAARERLSSDLAAQRTDELSEVNQQLASTNRALAAASRSKDEFLASVSHELRTPLTVISGFVESLERMHGDQRGVGDLLDPIQRNVRRLDGLVSDLLTLASLDAGAVTPLRANVELSPLLRSAPRELAGLADDEVVLSVPPSLRVEVDPRHLERVMTNLLVNAVRHGEPPVVVEAWAADDGTVGFSVRDHGAGIPPEVVEQVFERFARGPRAEATAGTGLGLAIVQELVEINGGSVDYEAADPGARFVVRLPVPDPEEDAAPVDPDGAGAPNPSEGSRDGDVAQDGQVLDGQAVRGGEAAQDGRAAHDGRAARE
jgi:signal transduction histidine kinase